jgi:hypothetical protein
MKFGKTQSQEKNTAILVKTDQTIRQEKGQAC